jgi:hypothetical protein
VNYCIRYKTMRSGVLLDITCGSSLYCTADDGPKHVELKHSVASSWFTTLPSFTMHSHTNIKLGDHFVVSLPVECKPLIVARLSGMTIFI